MATDLGKVGIVMKDTWSSSATYEVLDAVSYNNGLYIAKQAVPANTVPTNTTYWQVAVDGSIFTIKSKEVTMTMVGSSAMASVPEITPDKVIIEKRIYDGSKWVEWGDDTVEIAFWSTGILVTKPNAPGDMQVKFYYI